MCQRAAFTLFVQSQENNLLGPFDKIWGKMPLAWREGWQYFLTDIRNAFIFSTFKPWMHLRFTLQGPAFLIWFVQCPVCHFFLDLISSKFFVRHLRLMWPLTGKPMLQYDNAERNQRRTLHLRRRTQRRTTFSLSHLLSLFLFLSR